MNGPTTNASSVRPDGPGRIAPGQRVTCLPGSLPARDGGRGGGILVSIGPKTSIVDVYGGRKRRIPNELLHPEAGPWIAADRDARGLRTANASGRGWLPGWSWLGWSIAEHLEYLCGERRLPTPPPAPQRLIIVACGARKTACFEAPAGQMYVGSYHRAARRAAEAITTPDTRVMILSARYGLLDLDDVILRYEARLGQRFAITAQGLREQAEQLGLADTAEVIVLAPAAYADLASHVWPHAQRTLAGTRGIGDQMARLNALATGRTTVADLVAAGSTANLATTGDQHAVSIRGGLVHLADTPHARTGTAAPVCPANQPHRRWKLTSAPITCTRCATIVTRRRDLDRWCALVNRHAQAASTGRPHQDRALAPAATERRRDAHTGPEPRRPGRQGRRCIRPGAPRRTGGTSRNSLRDDWRHVPGGQVREVPLIPPGDGLATRRPSRRYPRHPIGRPPPRPRPITQARHAVANRSPAGAVPLIPTRSLTCDNKKLTNGSANGLRRASGCTTRPSPAGAGLANPLAPIAGPHTRHPSTIRPPQAAPGRCWRTARGLDRTQEVRPMTDPTTHPATAGTPEMAAAATPANGVAVADVRTLRHVTRAEQERLSADAEVERRARAAQLDLELREQRRAAARREREASAADKQARVEARRARRGARRARLRAAAPRWAERALFVLPIMFPMAVAWVGQIRFAMTVMGWPLPAAIVFAAGFELSTAYVARLDWLSRAAGDSALLFRGATWGFAAGAATMNYWHAADPGLAPNGEAVSYGLMSITGVVLWELLSTYRHRTALRAEGKLPAARPRFGLARWIWFNKLTRIAWLLTLRDGYTATDLAWRAGIGAVDLYGSAKDAREAVRAGRPVPRPEPLAGGERDAGQGGKNRELQAQAENRDSADRDLDRDDPARGEQRDGPTRHDHRDTSRDQQPDRTLRAGHPADPDSGQSPSRADVPALSAIAHEPSADPAGNDAPDRDEADTAAPAVNPDHSGDQVPAPPDQAAGSETDWDGSRGDEPRTSPDHGARRDSGKRAVSAKMLAYARQRLAEGARITGADLDRKFGTRDYGRKVLRRLATESRAAEA
ncbi:DUF6884 domain-containing protein [Phytohabitans aurantiacus]|uniref:DUF6884 domain-containing protein n=1 Tax=Phytohabitans aurantiacus TaxID=3016789 RepID=A0ABQ5R3Z5_9ACTN|nr:DUF6884 domain-containing protein [Phytohabitans aurantiacus]GLI00933.1 hypothetical protein Pa4123_62090 [Phytohabitans aurantiacus]